MGPNTVESPGNAQLQKLLAKEEQRLEQEQKRAAIERRRKQQQERFQQQHELNHPLRHHHTQQKTRTLKGTCRSPWRLGDLETLFWSSRKRDSCGASHKSLRDDQNNGYGPRSQQPNILSKTKLTILKFSGRKLEA